MENQFKPCMDCKVSKLRTDFHKNLNKDGHFNVCKKCQYIRNVAHRKDPKHKENYKRYRRNAAFKRRYGINLEQFEQMAREQFNKCLICECEPDKYATSAQEQTLCIDHCHTTGKIRGLLCHRCNTALGAFRENIEIIQKAIQYLQKHF